MPSKEVPLIVLAVCKAVAVDELPTSAAVTWLKTTSSEVPTLCPIAKVTPLPDAVEVTPVPPNKDKVSESRSIAIAVEPSDTSKSSAVICVST